MTRSGRSSSAGEFLAYQESWFYDVKRQVDEEGSPLALVNADCPHEIFRAMGIPYIVNQWWASVCAAKQRSSDYLRLLAERGYPDYQDRYSALALASAFDPNPENAPWGGLPTPTIVAAQLTGDSVGKIFELWAAEYGAAFYPFSYTVASGPVEPRWFDHIHRDWDRVIAPHRLQLMVDEINGLIEFLEWKTGRSLDMALLARVMRLSNEQAEWNRVTRDLVARSVPAPISVTDSIPSVMIPQWHRGSEWGRDAAERFHREVEEQAYSSHQRREQVRLMWIGRGLWFDMSFYRHFEQEYGAVFVWSMYLAVAADCYLRYGDDPVRALAARFCVMSELFNMPPWSSEWYAKEALHNQIDGVVHLTDAVRGTGFITRRLEEVGVPVLEISGNNVDSRVWDARAVTSRVSRFIRERAQPRAVERRSAH